MKGGGGNTRSAAGLPDEPGLPKREPTRASPGLLGRPAAWSVFALGLTLRLLHVAEIRAAPFFTYPINDARSYDEWARRIAAGDWLGTEAFYQAPLYPYFLAAVYSVLGSDPLVVRCVQALLGASSCVLLAQATARFASRPAGIVAGLAFAAYGPALYYDAMIGKSAADGFLLCLSLWCLSRATGGDHARLWAALGATLGALSLTRENALVFPAALAAWLLMPFAGALLQRGSPEKSGHRLGSVLWLTLGVVVVLAPIAVRNQVVAGELHVTTSQFGPNFYIGNNASATGRYRALRAGRSDARYERQDATALAEAALGRSLGPAEVSAYWSGRALDFVVHDPLAWLALKGRVLAHVFEATEWVDSEDLYTHAEHSRVLALCGSILHFGVVAPLAGLGVVVSLARRERRRASAPLLWMAGAYGATVVAFYVFGRYRYPLVPFAIVFAAIGVTEIRLLRARPRALVAAIGVGAAIAAVSNLQDARQEHQQAVTAHNLGRALHRAGRFGEAASQYRRAIALQPEAYLTENRLGELLQLQSRHEEARPHFERAAALWPRSGLPYLNLGMSLQALGHLEAARDAFQRAAEREPGKAEPHVRTGYLLRELRLYDRALASFARAREADPESVGGLAGSAWILAAHPDANRRDPQRAVRLAERALALGGRQPALLDTLAVATAATGDTDRATRLSQEAVDLAAQGADARRVASLRRRLRLYRAGVTYLDAAADAPEHDAPTGGDAPRAE